MSKTVFEGEEFKKRLAARMAEAESAKDTRRYDRAEILEKINGRVIGQEVISEQIATLVANRAARRSKNKPLATILISGPTGTGKTEMAKAVSEAVWGSDQRMYRLDCGALGTREDAMSSVIGSPAVFRNSSKGALVEHLIKFKGEGVLLFDEFEKAVPDAQAPLAKMLLNLLDEGRVQSQYDQQTYDATGTVVIMTSNLKQLELADLAAKVSDPEELELGCKRLLTGALAPEFLERLDLVTTTATLKPEHMARIVALHFNKLAKGHEVEIVRVGDGFYDLMFEGAKRFQATSTRGVIRWLEKISDGAFIDAVNEHKVRKASADWKDGKLILIDAEK